MTHSLTQSITHSLTCSIVKAELDGSEGNSVMPYVLPPDIISHMYMVPVVISPVIHASIHWNTLRYLGLSDLLSLLTSALIPVVLMLYLADKHNPYYNRSNNNNWQVPTHSFAHLFVDSCAHYIEIYNYSKNCGICNPTAMPTRPPCI